MLTLDEAIKHCHEKAKEMRADAERAKTEFKIYQNVLSLRAYNECKECANEHEQLAGWLEELQECREKDKWIPVSERLPSHDEYIKNNGLFNVSDGNRSYSEWFDSYDNKWFGEPTMAGFRVDYAVTAWQPLPEPYKKGGAE